MGGCFSTTARTDERVLACLDEKLGRVARLSSVGMNEIDLGEDINDEISHYASSVARLQLLAQYVLKKINEEDPQTQYVVGRVELDDVGLFSIAFNPKYGIGGGIRFFSKQALIHDPPHRTFVPGCGLCIS